MKQLIFLIFLAFIIGIDSCTPDKVRDLKYSDELVKVYGTMSKPNGFMALGDTLRLNITIPDTVFSTSRSVIVNSLQEALINMDIVKIDTVNRKGIFLVPPEYWVSSGYSKPTGSIVYYFDSRTKPYKLSVDIRPREKGIYLFAIASQLGELRVNNYFAANLLIDFAVPNRNINLARPYLDDAWANNAVTRPQGVYVFKVE